jgi:putative methyltransferase (TIGR04325 family)
MGHHMRWFKTLTKRISVRELLASSNQEDSPTYDSGLIAKVVVEKNIKLVEMMDAGSIPKLDFILLRPLLVFAFTQKKKLNVFDLGGGGGTHYHVTRKLMNDEIKLKWAVLETPSMVAEADSISNQELSFFSEYSHAVEFLENIDVALASSVFQYLSDPIEELIKFINLSAEVIFITRTALTDKNSTLRVIQKSRLKDNGPGSLPENFHDSEVQYPLTVVNKNLFIKTLSEKYTIVSEIEEDRAVHEINGYLVNQYGFLCIRK